MSKKKSEIEEIREWIIKEGHIWWCSEHQCYHPPRKDKYAPDHSIIIPVSEVAAFYPVLGEQQ